MFLKKRANPRFSDFTLKVPCFIEPEAINGCAFTVFYAKKDQAKCGRNI